MTINITDKIFLDIKELKLYFERNNIISTFIVCTNCGREAPLKSLSDSVTYLKYRCPKKGCQKIFTLFSSHLPLNKVVHIIYCLMLDINYFQLYQFFSIADSTIARYKDLLLGCYQKYIDDRPVFLGGQGVIVEVDESVLSRRGVIRCPTTHDDVVLDTIWILGGVDRTNERNFFLTRVENRTIPPLTTAMNGLILAGSVLYTDRHASYPATAVSLGLPHQVVNHTHGFRAEDGTHTNNIEGFWGHMKSSMRKENGVMRSNNDEWIVQYTFKRRYVMNTTNAEFEVVFIEILKLFFELNC